MKQPRNAPLQRPFKRLVPAPMLSLALLVLGLLYGSKNYFEAALLLALFSFVGSMAMAKFLLRGEVIE